MTYNFPLLADFGDGDEIYADHLHINLRKSAKIGLICESWNNFEVKPTLYSIKP